jgi:hypothetical protein
MQYTEIDPEIAQAAIEGYESAFDGEQKKLDAFYRQFICPSCKSPSLAKRFNAGHAFSDPSCLIARATLVCNECKCQFDPHSGLILELGNPASVPPHIPIIGSTPSSSER